MRDIGALFRSYSASVWDLPLLHGRRGSEAQRCASVMSSFCNFRPFHTHRLHPPQNKYQDTPFIECQWRKLTSACNRPEPFESFDFFRDVVFRHVGITVFAENMWRCHQSHYFVERFLERCLSCEDRCIEIGRTSSVTHILMLIRSQDTYVNVCKWECSRVSILQVSLESAIPQRTYAATSAHCHTHTKIFQDRPLGLPQPSLSESVLPCAPGPRQTTSSWRWRGRHLWPGLTLGVNLRWVPHQDNHAARCALLWITLLCSTCHSSSKLKE